MVKDQTRLVDCVVMSKGSGNWSALPCSRSGLGFICEKKGKG